MSDEGKTCWFTDDAELHPDTGCLSSGDWLGVATNGTKRWVSCDCCNKVWPAGAPVRTVAELLARRAKEAG